MGNSSNRIWMQFSLTPGQCERLILKSLPSQHCIFTALPQLGGKVMSPFSLNDSQAIVFLWQTATGLCNLTAAYVQTVQDGHTFECWQQSRDFLILLFVPCRHLYCCKDIVLRRSTSGSLGFSIVGGQEEVNCNQSFFIRSIVEGTPAYNDGRIRYRLLTYISHTGQRTYITACLLNFLFFCDKLYPVFT